MGSVWEMASVLSGYWCRDAHSGDVTASREKVNASMEKTNGRSPARTRLGILGLAILDDGDRFNGLLMMLRSWMMSSWGENTCHQPQ